MKTTVIALSDALVTHGGAVQSITLREPTAAECWELGEPQRWAFTKDGIGFNVDNDDAIKAYIERCVVEPKDPLILGQIKSLADGLRIKEAMLDFFIQARKSISSPSSKP